MNFDPQSNLVSGSDVPEDNPPARRHSPLADRLGQAGAAVVIVAFGGAALVAALIWQKPQAAPGQIALPPPVLVVEAATHVESGPTPETQPVELISPPRSTAADVPHRPPRPPRGAGTDDMAKEAYDTGRAHAAVGHLDDAVREFQRSLSINPDHAATYYALGMVQVRRGDMASARHCATELQSLDPSLASLLRNLLPRASSSRVTVRRAVQ